VSDVIQVGLRLHRDSAEKIKRLANELSLRPIAYTDPMGNARTRYVTQTQSDVVEMAVDALERELKARAADEDADARPLVE
jgi:hypothetical protein